MSSRRKRHVYQLVAALVYYCPADTLAESWICPQFMPDCKLDLFTRYRFEDVTDHSNTVDKLTGEANTVRMAAGMDTGTFKGFGLYGQIEYVASIDGGDYSDGGVNGVSSSQRAQILDAEGFEIKQANFRFDGREHISLPVINATLLRVGRQEIKHRADPFHRFLGNVGFRQHFQTYDAVRLTNRSLRDTIFDYSYLWNVNTFFGQRNAQNGNRQLDGHAFNMLYDGSALNLDGLQWGTLETYGYLLNFADDKNRELSSQTYGWKLDTKFPGFFGIPSSEATASVDYAHQWEYGNNPQSFNHDYFHTELGFNYFPKLDQLFSSFKMDSIGIILGYELLTGDGRNALCSDCKASAFQTPLGTNHAFLGAVDRFAGQTPPDGVQDRYFTLKSQFAPANSILNLLASYHDFLSDHRDYRYGGEWVLTAEWSPFSDNSQLIDDWRDNSQCLRTIFSRNMLIGIQYAKYQADQNTGNDQNGDLKLNQNVDKIWAFVQWKLDY